MEQSAAVLGVAFCGLFLEAEPQRGSRASECGCTTPPRRTLRSRAGRKAMISERWDGPAWMLPALATRLLLAPRQRWRGRSNGQDRLAMEIFGETLVDVAIACADDRQ